MDKTKIYIVGDQGPEHYNIVGIYNSKEEALKAFQAHRLSLLAGAKEMFEWSKEDAKESLERGKWSDGTEYTEDNINYFKEKAEKGESMYLEEIENLSNEDPETINNYPQETPFIEEHIVLDKFQEGFSDED